MKTKIINIDYNGISGLENLLKWNPEWWLLTCGSSRVESMMINGEDYVVNFAVFQSWDDCPEFKESEE